MTTYEKEAQESMKAWYKEMSYSPSLINRATRVVQRSINHLIPERIHKLITGAIKQVTRGVITGSDYTTRRKDLSGLSLEDIEVKASGRIKFYRTTAAAEGAATGFGGIIWGFADFPLWLSLKMKMLFDIASFYGIDTRDYRERLYILHIFQLTFSSQHRRNELIRQMHNWETEKEKLPASFNEFDWRTFQLEYRDYIDLAKLLQLVPGVGAVVGFYVNHRLTDKLGRFAMNAYRLRYFHNSHTKSGRKFMI